MEVKGTAAWFGGLASVSGGRTKRHRFFIVPPGVEIVNFGYPQFLNTQPAKNAMFGRSFAIRSVVLPG